MPFNCRCNFNSSCFNATKISIDSSKNIRQRGHGNSQGPVSYCREALAKLRVKRACDLARIPDGEYKRVAGCVIARQRPGTAKGFVFLSLEDETGISNVIVNPDLYEKYRVVINGEKFLRIEGLLQNQDK
jgi:error-prone DNA polymerase